MAAASAPSIVERIGTALREAVARAVEDAETAEVLFSGGLDSSVIALLARRSCNVRLVTVGLAGAPDLRWGRSAAELLGLPWRAVEVDEEAVLRAQHQWSADLADVSPTTRAVRVAFTLAVRAATESRLLTGQGADELFYGYAHFRPLGPAAAARRSREDLARLQGLEWPFALRVAGAQGVDLRAPFLDPALIEVAAPAPPPDLAGGELPKARLREAAEALGLPSSLALRPKKALQFGSGVDRVLRRRRSRTEFPTSPG